MTDFQFRLPSLILKLKKTATLWGFMKVWDQTKSSQVNPTVSLNRPQLLSLILWLTSCFNDWQLSSQAPPLLEMCGCWPTNQLWSSPLMISTICQGSWPRTVQPTFPRCQVRCDKQTITSSLSIPFTWCVFVCRRGEAHLQLRAGHVFLEAAARW